MSENPEIQNAQNVPKPSLTWAPDAVITLSGKEFETLVKVATLFDVPLSQLSTKELVMVFGPATDSIQEILKRSKTAGIAKDCIINPDGTVTLIEPLPEDKPKTSSSKMTNRRAATKR